MNRKLCLLFLVCLAVVLVKSESTIEIDENGDEYEVKKFNIQGRQLGSGRSQCVITRRKRATQPKPMYSNDGSDDDDVDDKEDGDVMKKEEQNPMLFYSPPSDNPTADENDEEDEREGEGEENSVQMNEMNKDKEEDGEEMNDTKNDNDKKEEMNEEEENEEENNEEDEDEDDTIEVVQLPQLPILGQLQSDGESVAAIASATGVAQTVHHNSANGIMVVQSHTPPKVNPQTHAVFQLVPVNQHVVSNSPSDEEDGDDGEDDFNYNEVLSPVTTTAIWSTGDDNANDLYDDYKPVRPQKVVKKTNKKPVKVKKNKNKKKKTSFKPKRTNKYKYSNKRRVSSGNKKRRYTKKRTNRNRVSVRRPVRRRKLRRGTTTRRTSSSSPSSGNSNRKNSNKNYNKNNNRNSSTKNKINVRKHNNKKHNEIIDQGENTYTRTMTMTQTGDEDGDRDVNCIYIRKDPPPTTQRPFWNILGRSANGAPIASGHFGKRKRVNVRFVA